MDFFRRTKGALMLKYNESFSNENEYGGPPTFPNLMTGNLSGLETKWLAMIGLSIEVMFLS